MSTLRTLALLLPSVVFAGGCVSEARGGFTPAPGEYDPADGVVDYAILYFDYEGPTAELGQMRKGLAQMLISDTADSTAYRVVERERVQELIDELNLNGSKLIDEKSAQKIGLAIGADRMVMGRYIDLFGSLDVTLRIVDTQRWTRGCALHVTGKPAEFLQLESQIADWLQASMAVGGMDPSKCPVNPGAPSAKATVPAAAVAKLSKALDAKDNHQPEQAKAILQELVKEEPDFKLAHDELVTLTK